jgi:hypothetical protein
MRFLPIRCKFPLICIGGAILNSLCMVTVLAQNHEACRDAVFSPEVTERYPNAREPCLDVITRQGQEYAVVQPRSDRVVGRDADETSNESGTTQLAGAGLSMPVTAGRANAIGTLGTVLIAVVIAVKTLRRVRLMRHERLRSFR